jgi:hypothetical protein
MQDDSGIGFNEKYERIIQQDGARITLCRNRFELIATPNNDINEQKVMQAFRDWIRWRRQEELRSAGVVSE